MAGEREEPRPASGQRHDWTPAFSPFTGAGWRRDSTLKTVRRPQRGYERRSCGAGNCGVDISVTVSMPYSKFARENPSQPDREVIERTRQPSGEREQRLGGGHPCERPEGHEEHQSNRSDELALANTHESYPALFIFRSGLLRPAGMLCRAWSEPCIGRGDQDRFAHCARARRPLPAYFPNPALRNS
jgi:hypothetical protein